HVDIDSLPANVDATLALPEWETGDHLLFPEHGTNVASHYPVLIGDPDKAFADADLVCGDDFYVQRHTAIPMEPRVLLAEWEGGGGRLCIWGAAKVPFFNRRHLASMFGMEETDIELVELDVGGGFGVRGEVYPEDYLVPFAA